MKKTTIAIITLLLAAPLLADKPVDETRPADADASISVDNLSGSVRVEGWDRPEIRVAGSLGDDTEGLTIEGGESSWDIEVEIPEGHWGGRRDVESRLEIWVPRGADVEVETVSASIRVADVDGRLDLESVSGAIDASGGGREVELETVSGAIDFTGSDASVAAESVSGRVKLRGVAGEVEVSSVSGRVDVEGSVSRRASFDSVSGELTLRLDPSPGASILIDAHSSNVNLSLPSAVSARFEVETFSGRIDNDFGPDGERTSRFAPGRALDHTTRDGSVRISIDTFSGNVFLRSD